MNEREAKDAKEATKKTQMANDKQKNLMSESITQPARWKKKMTQ